ncbi:CxxH/CxxC protein [Tuberibacillus sp. Marseille-P3662]|uniref:CxxH/CxxC protein n=1 Tax=Tuberibacillus sp. Marseille-P3662 TaxID=1965358 RepID=UPI000A1C7D49|nr:CxxH/CxxC protein [Tuberibacillus sp. Marseille-P3662]
MHYSCLEHVDMAIDIVIEEGSGEPPQLEELTEELKQSTGCEFCRNSAIYIVSNGRSIHYVDN